MRAYVNTSSSLWDNSGTRTNVKGGEGKGLCLLEYMKSAQTLTDSSNKELVGVCGGLRDVIRNKAEIFIVTK
jgi:hypothetical protein